jgi:hypothetical protein
VDAKNGALGTDAAHLDLDLFRQAVVEDRAQNRVDGDEQNDAAQHRDHDQEDPTENRRLGHRLRQLLMPVAGRRPEGPNRQRDVEDQRNHEIAPEPVPRHVEPAAKRGQEAADETTEESHGRGFYTGATDGADRPISGRTHRPRHALRRTPDDNVLTQLDRHAAATPALPPRSFPQSC